MNRETANRLFLLRDGGLVFTGGALLEDEQGRLRLETTGAENVLLCWPPNRLEGCGGLTRENCRGPLGAWRIRTEEPGLGVSVRQTSRRKYAISVQPIPEHLKDVRLRIRYRGDIGMLFLGNTMISDNFWNGDVWEIGLREYREALKNEPLVLTIAPIRKGSEVIAETAMAARTEKTEENIAELEQISLQPVYDIPLFPET